MCEHFVLTDFYFVCFLCFFCCASQNPRRSSCVIRYRTSQHLCFVSRFSAVVPGKPTKTDTRVRVYWEHCWRCDKCVQQFNVAFSLSYALSRVRFSPNVSLSLVRWRRGKCQRRQWNNNDFYVFRIIRTLAQDEAIIFTFYRLEQLLSRILRFDVFFSFSLSSLAFVVCYFLLYLH